MKTIELTQDNFDLITSKGTVILDMWASWCGPCRAFSPVFDSGAARHGDVVFAKVDTESQPGIARKFGVRAIPTIVAMRDGVVVYSKPGALSASALDDLVQKVQAIDVDEQQRHLAEQGGSSCCGCGHG